jgi:hypothetical protein
MQHGLLPTLSEVSLWVKFRLDIEARLEQGLECGMLDICRQSCVHIWTDLGAKYHTLIVVVNLRTLRSVGDVGRKCRKGRVFPLFSVAELLERVIRLLLRRCSQVYQERLHMRLQSLKVLLAMLPLALDGVAR